MKIKKTAGYFEPIPRGYCVAYGDPVNRRTVCYPIGLHYIMRLAYLIRMSFYNYRPSKWESELARAYAEGHCRGLSYNISLLKKKNDNGA